MNLTKKSKQLSFVLRHNPGKAGLTLDIQGWADVNKLLTSMGLSKEELDFIVENNNKKRFEFSEDGTKIRASQGHSVQVDLGYEKQAPPEFLYHGTVEKFIAEIREDGLSKMTRHHVHLSADRETATIVGKRRGKPLILEVKAGEMHRDGLEFYLTRNGVWLTDHVPAKYLI